MNARNGMLPNGMGITNDMKKMMMQQQQQQQGRAP